MDRISNLPDELICHIGSFLSTKDVACTEVLSRRWWNLFTIEPELRSSYMNKERFRDFTNKLIALPLDSRIWRFALLWGFEFIEPADIDCCLSHALKHGVVDLELRDVTVQDEGGEEEGKYSLPLEVFTCETVAKLSLLHNSIPAKAYLPSLKILKLYYVRIYDLDTLLSACPVLEELLIYDFRNWKVSRRVSSQTTMKRLTLDTGYEVWGYSDEPEFSFDTPALTYLKYSDFARKKYPIVNLSSLVQAKLGIYKERGTLPNPINLFNGLKNVQILSVTDKTMELIHDFREAIPMFENLSHLTLVNKENCCWFGLPVLLQKSPKLNTLTVKGSLLHSDDFYHFEPLCECLLGYSFLLTCRIEVLKITKFEGRYGEMSQLKQVLEKLPYLELLEIHTMAGNEDEEMKIKKDLLTFPRASSKCKIRIVSQFPKVCDEKDEEK